MTCRSMESVRSKASTPNNDAQDMHYELTAVQSKGAAKTDAAAIQ